VARQDLAKVEHRTTTSADGLYPFPPFPQLRPSTYTMTVEAANFANAEVKDLVLLREFQDMRENFVFLFYARIEIEIEAVSY
jgi:hypothetical protein